MASLPSFIVGMIWIMIGAVALIQGSGYIMGQPVDGWPIRLIGLVSVLGGVTIAVLAGILGVI